MSTKKPVWLVNADRLAYGPAFDLQREIVAARKAGAVPDILLFCEHPHVITLGRNGETKNLLANQNVLKQMNVEFHETDRGGDITYHGPGQIVGYPILDLTQHKRDVRWYVEQLEEVMIRTAADYGLKARRVRCRHGIWIDPPARNCLAAGPSFSSDISATRTSGVSTPEALNLHSRAQDEESAALRDQGRGGTPAVAAEESVASAPEVSPAPNVAKQAPEAGHNFAQPVRAGEPQKKQSAVGARQASAETCSPETGDDRDEEKLAALGVHLSRWVTSHGFAFNVSTDLRLFDLIVPCGIQGKRATSLERALGRAVSIDQARARLARHFVEIFHAESEPRSLGELHALLDSRISSTT